MPWTGCSYFCIQVFPKQCKRCATDLLYGPHIKAAPPQVIAVATALEDMSKDMEKEKEDLKVMVEQVQKNIPKRKIGDSEKQAIANLEAWKRKRLAKIAERQRILQETHYVLKSMNTAVAFGMCM